MAVESQSIEYKIRARTQFRYEREISESAREVELTIQILAFACAAALQKRPEVGKVLRNK